MIRIIAKGGAEAAEPADPSVLWIDLEAPDEAEEKSVEAAFNVDVPVLAERAAFEESARFYEENGALYLTATLLGRRDDGPFISGAVTFILRDSKLVTVRQIRPRAFDVGQTRSSARIGSAKSGGDVALALLEGAVERLADLLAEATREANAIAADTFVEHGPSPDLRAKLRELGRVGVMTALSHDSLSSVQQLIAYARHCAGNHGLDSSRLAVLHRDAEELERLAEALQTRLSYLQDGSLGLINAAQNDVLKVISLVTIAFVPPTLIASIFGMNFTAMSWFQKPWGPWLGFLLMIIAPASLFLIAKWRRWF
jgi:magnesium transporter